MHGRGFTWLGFGALAAGLSACQLVAGISGYQVTAGAASSGSGVGGAASSSSGGGGAASSSSGINESGTGGGGAGTATSSSATSSSSSGSVACDGGAVVCGDSCDLSTDPMNCGYCGHGCGTEVPCTGGLCATTAIAGPYASITAIAAGSSGVYWAIDAGGMYALGGMMGSTPLPLASTPTAVGGLGVSPDGQTVYFTTAAGLHSWKPSPVSAVLTVLVAGTFTNPGPVVVVGSTVGWMENTSFNVTTTPAASTVMYGGDVPSALAADATSFWTFGATSMTLLRTDASPPGANPVGDLILGGVTLLAADDAPAGYVYAGVAGGTLLRVSKQGGVLKSVTTITKPVGLVVDASSAFWLEGGTSCAASDGRLWRIDTSASVWAPVLVADHLTCPDHLAQDTTNLYFSSGPLAATPGAVVMRVAK